MFNPTLVKRKIANNFGVKGKLQSGGVMLNPTFFSVESEYNADSDQDDGPEQEVAVPVAELGGFPPRHVVRLFEVHPEHGGYEFGRRENRRHQRQQVQHRSGLAFPDPLKLFSQ